MMPGGPSTARLPGPPDRGDLPRGTVGRQYQVPAGQPLVISQHWPIQAVEVGNWSNQWLMLHAGLLTHAVPPYTTGVRLNVWGLATLSIDAAPAPWVAGAGYVLPATIAGEVVTIAAYNRRWAVESSGTPLPPQTAIIVVSGGNNVVLTSPRPLLVRSLTSHYTSTATVGNRQIRLDIGPIGGYWQVSAGATQAASLNIVYNTAGAVARETAVTAADDILLPLPENLVLGASTIIRVHDVALVDVNDTQAIYLTGSYLMGTHL